jgi:transcription termination factor NusB
MRSAEDAITRNQRTTNSNDSTSAAVQFFRKHTNQLSEGVRTRTRQDELSIHDIPVKVGTTSEMEEVKKAIWRSSAMESKRDKGNDEKLTVLTRVVGGL